MDASTVFGLLSTAVLVLALTSDFHVFQKLGLILLLAWATTNIAVEMLGFAQAPVVIPSLDAAFAIIVATIGYINRSRVALVVFLLYALVGSVHVGAFVLHKQATYGYYATLNVLFLAQLLTVGAASGRMAVCRWIAFGRQRFRLDPSRG